MKLELKHLAPYLPYGLKGIYYEVNNENTIIDIIGFSFFNNKLHYQLKLNDGVLGLFDEDFKPILRPLSDLTEDNADFLSSDTYLNLCEEGSGAGLNYYELKYHETTKLFEKHFDVFGLIERGLAIDINTI